jgi:hypothetical protein
VNNSLAGHYYKLSADQDIAHAQLEYGITLYYDHGVSMNKSLPLHSGKSCANQGCGQAQLYYARMLFRGEDIGWFPSSYASPLFRPAISQHPPILCGMMFGSCSMYLHFTI